ATLVLTAGAGWALAGARWTHRSPRLAVLLWQATVIGVVTAAVGLPLSAGLAPYGRGIVPALGELAADLASGTTPPAATPAHLVAVGRRAPRRGRRARRSGAQRPAAVAA